MLPDIMLRSLLFLLTALTACADFRQPVRTIPLDYGQKQVTLTFVADSPIRRATPNCDCTSIEIQGQQLEVRVDTSGFDGEVEKTIDATTADGRTTRLVMCFRVPPALVLSTKTLRWQRGAAANPVTLRLTIPKGSPITQVTEASLSGNAFDYDPRKGSNPREFLVIVTPKSTDRRLLNRLIITTDSADPRYRNYIIYLQVK